MADIDGAFSDFKGAGQLSEESAQTLESLRIGFKDKITQLASETSNAELSLKIQTESDSLVTALRALLVPEQEAVETGEVSAIEDPEVPAEPVVSEADKFLNSLTTLTTEAVDSFEKVVTENSTLPALSEPSGKGATYQKFLGIYNSLSLKGSTLPDHAAPGELVNQLV